MSPAGFELEILAGERPQTHALDCAAIGIGVIINYPSLIAYYNSMLVLFIELPQPLFRQISRQCFKR